MKRARFSCGLSFVRLVTNVIMKVEKTALFNLVFSDVSSSSAESSPWAFSFRIWHFCFQEAIAIRRPNLRVSPGSVFSSPTSDLALLNFQGSIFFRGALFFMSSSGDFLLLSPELAWHRLFVTLAELHAVKALFILFCHETYAHRFLWAVLRHRSSTSLSIQMYSARV